MLHITIILLLLEHGLQCRSINWMHNILEPRCDHDIWPSKSNQIISRGCTYNANKSPVRLRSTLSNCHVLFCYPHRFVHVSFNYHTSSMRCRDCHQQNSVPVYNQPCHLDCNCDHQISTSITAYSVLTTTLPDTVSDILPHL